MALLFGIATLWFWCVGLVVTVRWVWARVGGLLPAIPVLGKRVRRVR